MTKIYSLKAELHCHSQVYDPVSYLPFFYDSVQSVEKIIDTCLIKNIRILALTDHNTLAGYKKARQIIKDRHLPILLIPACEISTQQGHVLAYGITTEIPKKLPGQETISLIHAQGGLAVAAHPFLIYGLGKQIFTINLDAIEGYNSFSPHHVNRHSIPAARTLKIPYTVGSDAHVPSDIGRCYNLFPSDTKSVSQFLKYLKLGNFKPQPSGSTFFRSYAKWFFSNLKNILTPNHR